MATPSPSVRQAGSLDESFGEKGIWHLNIPNLRSQTLLLDVTAQSPSTLERLYFTGDAPHDSGGHYILGRLLPEGSLDKSFGVDGIVSGSLGSAPVSIGNSIILQADGKILMIGLSGNAPALARFFSDGKLDREFGSNGLVTLPIPQGLQAQFPGQSKRQDQDSSYSVSASTEGKILIVKTFNKDLSPSPLAYLLNIDGSLDTSFNGKGYVQVVHPEHDPNAITMNSGYIDEKGRIMVGGNLLLASGESMPLFACYTPDGRPDPAFGNGGFVVLSSPSTQFTTVRKVIRQPNNRLLALGWAGSAEQGLLISLEPDGKANIQFNRGQPLLTQVDGRNTTWRNAVMQPDGKIVLLGNSHWPGEDNNVIVARLLSDAKDDLSFNDQGWVITSLGAVNRFDGLTLQDDGKIVIAGFLSTSVVQGVILRFHGKS
ncbi:hypothetical protein [Pseudomonas sp. NPDC087615]|uniref:hypothetical protein n=1 Tax=Pseudomonas sp. NPDC087615 TaxID=3364443 RepID=UPI003811F29F